MKKVFFHGSTIKIHKKSLQSRYNEKYLGLTFFQIKFVKKTEAATRGVLKKRCSSAPESLFSCRPEAENFIQKETLAQLLSCEFCKISKTPILQNISERLLLKRP